MSLDIFIKQIAWRIRIAIGRRINPTATHVFWDSKKQRDVIQNTMFPETMDQCFFKGKPYTEMKAFQYGVSNWDDAKIVGFGTYGDAQPLTP